MSQDRLARAALVLGVVLGVGYIAAGVIGWVADVTDGDGSDLVFWVLLLVGGGALILVGLFVLKSPPMLSTAVAALGALAGSLALVWSIVVPILALAFIALLVLGQRRPAPAPEA